MVLFVCMWPWVCNSNCVNVVSAYGSTCVFHRIYCQRQAVALGVWFYLCICCQRPTVALGVRFYSHPPVSLESIKERVLFVLNHYDKVDPEKVSLSHF